MKKYSRGRIVFWIVALMVTAAVCRLSVQFKHASDAPLFFETCEEPITFIRVLGVALGLELPFSGNACINNLRQIDGAKQQWALEQNVTNLTAIVTWKDIAPYIGKGKSGGKPWCPKGGVYRLGRLGDAPTCSIPGDKLE